MAWWSLCAQQSPVSKQFLQHCFSNSSSAGLTDDDPNTIVHSLTLTQARSQMADSPNTMIFVVQDLKPAKHHKFTQSCTYMYAYTCMYAHTHTCMHTHTHIHMYAHCHKDKCSRLTCHCNVHTNKTAHPKLTLTKTKALIACPLLPTFWFSPPLCRQSNHTPVNIKHTLLQWSTKVTDYFCK